MPSRARKRQTSTPSRGTVVHVRFDSRVLRGNRLGDPSVRRVPIYLPPGYDSSTRRYPVLFALAGFAGGGRSWLNTVAWGEALDERLDRLHASGAMSPSIVVMPDCFTRWGGSQYRNSTATGRYADHVIRELVPWVDRHLRTLGGSEHRGIFGKSSGGYGALTLAMRHPDVFGAVACHSGDMGFEYCYFPDFPKFLRQVHESGGVARFVRDFHAARRKTQGQFDAMNILAMSACYSPRPRAPLGIAWPVDLATGETDRRVWQRWLRCDPLRMLSLHAPALRRLRFLYLDCGTRDEFGLLWGARRMHAQLRRRRIRHVYEEFDDGHMNVSYRLDRSLPRLSRALRPRRTARRK